MSAYFRSNPVGNKWVSNTHSCPLCEGRLHRVNRRPVDRLTSMVVPVQRFRCERFSCQWEGNYRIARDDFVSTDAQFGELEYPVLEDPPRKTGLPWSFVLTTSLSLAGIVAIMAVATTDEMSIISQEVAYIPPSDQALTVAPKVEVARKAGP